MVAVSRSGAILATGTTRPRQLADRFAERVRVDDFLNGSGDDSSAINAAIDRCIALRAQGVRANVHLGQRTYNYSTPHAQMLWPVGIIGEGHAASVIKVSSSLSGDVFSWSDVWYETSIQNNFSGLETHKSSPVLRGFSVVGTREAAAQQNAFMFYDRTDGALIEDVEVWFLKGRALMFGALDNRVQGYLRESRIVGFGAYACGDAGVPVVEFSSYGSGDATNSNEVYGLSMWACYGPGLVLRNGNTTKTLTYMDFFGVRVEGGANTQNDDLIVIGDDLLEGGVSHINFYGLKIIGADADTYSLTIKAPNAAAGARHAVMGFNGLVVGPGGGGGINIQAGRELRFDVTDLNITGTELTVGPASQGIGDIVIQGHGLEDDWSTDIDSTSASLVRRPVLEVFP